MVQDPVREAFQAYAQGNLRQAEELCRAILARDPAQPDIRHLLGILLFRLGQPELALEHLRCAAASPRATAEMHNNLGAALKAVGRHDEAIAAFERALLIAPDYAWALNNLGVVHRDRGRIAEAIAAFRRAIAIQPGFAEAQINLRAAYRELVPPWHFAMMHDKERNALYERAIARSVAGKNVLDIGTGAGLLAMIAARAGARHVTTCESVAVIAELARDIVQTNGLADRVTVIAKSSDRLAAGSDLPERAQVLVTEIFSSNLIGEGILKTIEDAHERLLEPSAQIIPRAASAMGYLIGGVRLEEMLFVKDIQGFDLSAFDALAPAILALGLDGMPHRVLSGDTELLRLDFGERHFPMLRRTVTFEARASGRCIGVAQWIRLELDDETVYENRPSAAGTHAHWSHLVYRFAQPVMVREGDFLHIAVRHDRSALYIDRLD